MNAPISELSLSGLDGGNPLAFLAALGAVRSITLARPEWHPRLAWRMQAHWTPVLGFAESVDESAFLDALATHLPHAPGREALALDDNIKFTQEAFRSHLQSAVAAENREAKHLVHMLTALASDALQNDAGLVPDSALRTMSGAGHQHFLKFMRQLIESTDRDHLHKALFKTWLRDDPQPSLRWDPNDDRRYALRWKEPSNDPIRTVRGANRLAIEALPLFTTTVVDNDLKTPGFKGRGMNDTYWTWPIWDPFVGIETARSLLTLKILKSAVTEADFGNLSGMGIRQIFQSQRLTIGKYRNFSHPQAIA